MTRAEEALIAWVANPAKGGALCGDPTKLLERRVDSPAHRVAPARSRLGRAAHYDVRAGAY